MKSCIEKIKAKGMLPVAGFFQSKMICSSLCLILAILVLSSCTGPENPVETSIRQFQVPVLKYRQNNPVLQIKMHVPADAPAQKVTAFSLITEGTDDLSDIKAVSILYMGKDTLWRKYEKAASKAGAIVDPVYPDDFRPVHYVNGNFKDDYHPILFGNEMSPSSKLIINGEQDLMAGDNYFWLMYELSDDADLQHKVDGALMKISFSDGSEIEPVYDDAPIFYGKWREATKKDMSDLVGTI